MITRGMSGHAFLGFLIRKGKYCVGGSTKLESTNFLEVFTLQIHLAGDFLVDGFVS
jgi:hypothetical protein